MDSVVTLASLTRIAQGGEAEIFAWNEGQVLRLMRSPAASDALRRERAAMAACASHGVRVPAPGELVEVDGRPGLVMERLPGDDLLSAIARKPWTVLNVGNESGRIHAAFNGVDAPPELGSLREGIRLTISGSPRIPSRLKELALAELERLSDGTALCHGDFHPGNVMRAADGSPVIIDWPHAAAGPPVADFARTLVILSAGGFPPGTPVAMRLLAPIGRAMLVRSYRRAYLENVAVPLEDLDGWMLVWTAERLIEDVPGERLNLLRMAARYNRRIKSSTNP